MGSETRDTILRSLRAEGQCTVKELAEAVGISPVSVRHHLINLQAEGLVTAKEVRHGVGRPHHMFSLTDDALELFPTRYFQLTNRLLGQIKGSMQDDQVEVLFSSMADSMAESISERVKNLPLEQRLRQLVELLSQEGYDADYERRGDEFFIREMSCPYLQLAITHPEVCLLDQGFIAKALALPVERITSLTEGDSHCAFTIVINAEETG
jgi:predicted ArsR family transcriptional regulator